ncbi:beta-glucosidase family protein [Nocardioides campestrisoli]|uniref:beta-glucosidase family protein n=1 Tax=Nocardioides campestrisoli TaxID=2736757 RepID=UPI0015E63CFA|nr:glycoside hydrolase family 3 C-terminal domain-containing protein [Nocardioides campestrisoli]
MRKALVSVISAIALVVTGLGATISIQQPATGADLPWMNTDLSPQERTELLLDAMTLDQKLEQIFNKPVYNEDLDDGVDGNGKGCDFTQIGRHIEGIPELAIPDFRMANGGTGIRGGDCLPEPTATALPAQISSAATFDRALTKQWGGVLDLELRAWAHQVLWGPVLNLIRTPYGGRNNEFFSEDPYLTGVLASRIIEGIQARKVSQATAKHFVANDSEFQFERWTAAIRVPSRAMHELYLLPFEMAVKNADVASVMCAYGYVNFSYNCDSKPLLQQTLRQDWGFDGYVFSDRRAQQSTVPSILAGTDVEVDEQPEWYQPDLVKAAIRNGEITEANIDDMLRERYIKMFEYGDFDDPATSFGWDQLKDELAQGGPHAQVAKNAAAESLVLLRNERKQLPLNAGAIDSVALIGPKWFAGEATLPPRSGDRTRNISVNAPYEVTPREGLLNTLRKLGAEDATVTYNNGNNIGNAVDLAERSDVTILMVGDVARETWDKNSNYQDENPGGNVSGANKEVPDLDLPTVQGTNQQQLIPRVLDAVPNTVMVLKTQGQVNMPWIDKVRTLVEAWYPGQEDGNVVADALFGVTNFSGKLPVTFGRTDREAAYESQEQYPGYQEDTGVPGGIGRDPIPGAPQRVVRYTEGLKMGYRWYQATGTKPLFPFGYGQSYTTFDYSKLDVDKIRDDQRRTSGLRVSYTVTNTGDITGQEASQVYLRLPREARENFNRLVGFDKVQLTPGESKRVSVVLNAGAANHPFSYFRPEDPDDLRRWADGEWTTPKGDFDVYVGRSSESLPLKATVGIGDIATEPPGPPSTKSPSKIKKPTVTPKRVTPQVRARIKFEVVSGGQPATGKVQVKRRGAVVGRDTLNRRGIAKVQIRKLQAGKQKVRLVYLGSEVSERASRNLVIRVRNRR